MDMLLFDDTGLMMRRTDGQNRVSLWLIVNLIGSLRFDLACLPIRPSSGDHVWRTLLNSEDTGYSGSDSRCWVEDGRIVVMNGPGALLLDPCTNRPSL